MTPGPAELEGSRPTGLSLCVINFNGKSVVPTTFFAIAKLRHHFDEVLLVDNGSTDGSPELVERDHPFVKVIRLGQNLGAGGARNAGLREAANDLILFIDNDVELTETCITRLVAALEQNPGASLAAASIVYAHQRDTVQYNGAQCHFLGLQVMLDENIPVAAVPPEIRKVGSLSTCAFLAHRGRLPAGVRFDESFFYIFEDHDFGVRARLRGSEVLSVTDAHCFHGAGTEGLSIRQLGTYSSKRTYCLIRNRWIVILKNYSWRTILVLAPFIVFYELAQLGVVIKKRWHREWFGATGWILGHLPQIFRERARVQASRVLADRDLLVGGPIPFRKELVSGRLDRIALACLNGAARAYWSLAARLI